MLIVLDSILVNKDMLEPSYNDLKSHSLKQQLLLYQPNIYQSSPDDIYQAYRMALFGLHSP